MNAPLEEANAGLIKQARAGDARAFEALAKEVERPLYRHVQRIVGESADAEDCVQDALFSAWRSIRAFEGDSFRAWIFRIATNRALDRLRSRKRHPELPLDPPADDAEIPWAAPATPGPDLVPTDGELDGGRRAAVESHLAACDSCRTRLAQLRATARLIAALPSPVPARSLVPRVAVPIWLASLRTLATIGSGAALFLFIASALTTSFTQTSSGGAAAPALAPQPEQVQG